MIDVFAHRCVRVIILAGVYPYSTLINARSSTLSRTRRCTNRQGLEEEFLSFRQRELDAGRPLLSGNKKKIRAPSIIHHLCNTLRVLRICTVTGAVTTIRDAGNRRVAKAQEAAERLLGKRLHTQAQRGVSIEPACWETMAPKGEAIHQTFTFKISASEAGSVKLKGLQLIKRRGTGDEGAELWVDRALQLPAVLAPGSEFAVAIWGRPVRLGMLSDVAVFSFEQCAESFSVCRFVSVRAGDPEAEELLKPSAPFARKRRVPRARYAPIVEGRPPISPEGLVPYVNSLGQHRIPTLFRWMLENADHVAHEKICELRREVTRAEGLEVECPETYQNQQYMQSELQLVYTSRLALGGFSLINTACSLCGKHKGEHHPITCARTGKSFLFCNDPRRRVAHAKCAAYSNLYSHLLWAEEKAMEVDIRAFDIAAAPLEQVNLP